MEKLFTDRSDNIQQKKKKLGRKPRRPEPRGRRRNKQTHRSILEATLKLVTERGYPAVSIEAIAAEAGVGKQTIYRWWSCKASLVFEALSKSIVVSNPPIDKGNVQADLEEFLGSMFTNISKAGGGRIISSLFSEAQADPDFATAFRDEFINPRRDLLRQILNRAKSRNELRADLGIDLAIDCFYGPMVYRMLNPYAPADRRFARTLVAQLLRGFRP